MILWRHFVLLAVIPFLGLKCSFLRRLHQPGGIYPSWILLRLPTLAQQTPDRPRRSPEEVTRSKTLIRTPLHCLIGSCFIAGIAPRRRRHRREQRHGHLSSSGTTTSRAWTAHQQELEPWTCIYPEPGLDHRLDTSVVRLMKPTP